MIGAIAVAFTSCNGDDDNGPNGSTSVSLLITSDLTPNDAPGVNRVLAEIWGPDEQPHVVASAPFNQLGFSLLLENTPQANIMLSLNRLFDWDITEIFTVSDTAVRVAAVWTLYGITSTSGDFLDEDFAGIFFRLATSGDGVTEYFATTEFFIYADRAVSITGTDDGNGWRDEMSMNLAQGWNRVFETFAIVIEDDVEIEIYRKTTTPVTGMTWNFMPFDFDNGDHDHTSLPLMRVNAQENTAAARVIERAAERRSNRNSR